MTREQAEQYISQLTHQEKQQLNELLKRYELLKSIKQGVVYNDGQTGK